MRLLKSLVFTAMLVCLIFSLGACASTSTDNGDSDVLNDTEAVAETMAAITWNSIKGINETQGAVTCGLNLFTDNETNTKNGTSISWSSAQPGIISDTGEVTRPAYTENNMPVTVTAEVHKNEASAAQEFNLTVLKLPQSDEEAVVETKAAITWDTIEGNNKAPDGITYNLNLAGGTRNNGTLVEWTSEPAIIAPDGVVSFPSYETGNITVTLTANMTRNNASDKIEFSLVVLCMPQTDAEAVRETKAGITWESISNNQEQNEITESLNIDSRQNGNGTLVEWTSSDPTVVASNGMVTRPADKDWHITLTASITKNETSATVIFEITVLKLPVRITNAVLANNSFQTLYKVGEPYANDIHIIINYSDGTQESIDDISLIIDFPDNNFDGAIDISITVGDEKFYAGIKLYFIETMPMPEAKINTVQSTINFAPLNLKYSYTDDGITYVKTQTETRYKYVIDGTEYGLENKDDFPSSEVLFHDVTIIDQSGASVTQKFDLIVGNVTKSSNIIISSEYSEQLQDYEIDAVLREFIYQFDSYAPSVTSDMEIYDYFAGHWYLFNNLQNPGHAWDVNWPENRTSFDFNSKFPLFKRDVASAYWNKLVQNSETEDIKLEAYIVSAGAGSILIWRIHTSEYLQTKF